MFDPARVAEAFALGRPHGPLAPVPGAWSNRLWRLETEQGRFALKELRGPAAASEWRPRLQVAMNVERAAWTADTIPMAEPMPAATGGGWLAEVATTTEERVTVRCHRWVPGTPATAVAPNPAIAADVGRSLAAIHALGLAARGPSDGGEPPRPGPKNAVVRPDRRVALLDWDYAGPILAASELLVTALSFAGGTLQPDPACVRACVRGYQDAGGRIQPPDLLDTAAIHQEGLAWLWLNVDRCLGRRLRDRADQRLAQRLAPQLLGSFAAQVATVDRWAGRLLEHPGSSA